jgi:predicted negative regulator of RcsB-dependent stress response
MVDELLTDREQEEALRNWWRENWSWVLSGIVLGLALLFGWRWWEAREVAQGESAALAYREFLGALDRGDREAAEAMEGELENRHGGSPYVDQGHLAFARVLVEQGDFDAAATRLRTVMEKSDDEELRQVARLRLARVLIEQSKYDEALGLLDPGKAGAFASLEHSLRGDALAAKGDDEGARREYEAALAAPLEDPTVDRNLLRLKLDALGSPPAPAGEAS